MGKNELVALFNLSSWCLVMVERFVLVVPQGCLRFVFDLFDLILYVPSTIFQLYRDGSSWVEPVLS